MFKIDGRHLSIKIDLPNGVYTFYPESGTGKTRLYNFLKQAKSLGYKVDGYTYSDFLSKTPINIEGNQIYLFDRYNMYDCEQIRDKIKHINNAIILIDFKSSKPFPAKRANLEMLEDSIEVFL